MLYWLKLWEVQPMRVAGAVKFAYKWPHMKGLIRRRALKYHRKFPNYFYRIISIHLGDFCMCITRTLGFYSCDWDKETKECIPLCCLLIFFCLDFHMATLPYIGFSWLTAIQQKFSIIIFFIFLLQNKNL